MFFYNKLHKILSLGVIKLSNFRIILNDRLNLSMFGIGNISLNDFLDIFLVAFIIYKVIIIIKETKTWILFKGIFVLLIVTAIALILNLNTIAWLLQYLFSVGIIALIILFQPELRKALEGIGNTNLISSITGVDKFSSYYEEEFVNIIVNASRIMANAKTGALIVIEQDISLAEYQATGIFMDALVSPQLLVNIFEDKTPLHDGAVIIKSNRIVSASCILPLTQVQIGQLYGTRHRAGVGISEVTDSIVIIVSEESGHINLAQYGKLYKNLSDDKLKSWFVVEKPIDKKKIKFRKVFKNDK